MDIVEAIRLLAVAGLLVIAHEVIQACIAKRSTSKLKLRLPPGPAGWPVLGNLSIFADPKPHRRLEELAKEHGPVMSIRLGFDLAVVVSNADMAREVLKQQDNNFASRPPRAAYDHLVFQEGTCGFQPYGARHQHVRRIMVAELLAPKKIQRFDESRQQEVAAAVKSILMKSPNEVDIQEIATALTINNMTQMLMGKRFCQYQAGDQIGSKSDLVDPQEAAEYKQLICEINRLLGIPIIGDNIPFLGFLDVFSIRTMRKLRNKLDFFLSKIINDHKQRIVKQSNSNTTSSPKDFVDVLLDIPGEQGVDKDQAIKGMLTDMLLAGSDTSASVAEWAMAELLRNPLVLIKAQEELDWVVGKDRRVQEADLASLPYIQAVLKETMRLHTINPLLIPHYSMQDCKLGGYDIPANTIVFISSWNIHRNQEAWDNPLQFRPERFIESDLDIKGQNFDMLPFGSGRRGCPGTALGWTVATFFVASLIHSFDWCLPHGQKPQDLDMSETFGLVSPKTHHLRAVAIPRLPLHLY